MRKAAAERSAAAAQIDRGAGDASVTDSLSDFAAYPTRRWHSPNYAACVAKPRWALLDAAVRYGLVFEVDDDVAMQFPWLFFVRAVALLYGLIAAPELALAHGGDLAEASPWAAWRVTPEIIVGVVLAGLLYGRGIRCERTRAGRTDRAAQAGAARRHVAFFAGLIALYVFLQSPIEPLSDRSFILHQIEHMGLRTIVPFLLLLALPQATLMRGLPRGLRDGLVRPILGNSGLRGLFGALSRPVPATLLFVGTTYFWMVPSYHDQAILDPHLHELWHMTLLASGLLFFWRLFDRRLPPQGPSLPARLGMIWGAIVGNTVLGAYLAFKTQALYTAYAQLGRVWTIPAATDERFGGLVVWIAGCMMLALAGGVCLRLCALREDVLQDRRLRKQKASSGRDAPGVSRNRTLGLGLAGFVVLVFLISVTLAIVITQASPPV